MSEEVLPGEWNLYDHMNLPIFEQWDKGAEAILRHDRTVEELDSKENLYKMIMLACLVFGILTLGFGIGIVLLVIAFVLRKNGGFRTKIRQQIAAANEELTQARYQHTDYLAEQVGAKLMIGQWAWFRTARKALLYSNERFIYLDADASLLVAYNKSDIKEVYRERVHTGSHTNASSNTFGGATAIGDTGLSIGGANTNTNSNTTDFYEWHFDVLTNYLPYPKVSLVLTDSPSVENMIGKAYAILKP